MCVILDANARDDVFGRGMQTRAGRHFLDAVENQQTLLIVGGSLQGELCSGSRRFEAWLEMAIRNGRAIALSHDRVDALAEKLREEGACKSDDEHVIALARASGARLLYSKDGALQADFKNRTLLRDPRGKVLPTGNGAKDRRNRNRLLGRRALCPNR